MFSKMFNQYQSYPWASAFLIISLIFNFFVVLFCFDLKKLFLKHNCLRLNKYFLFILYYTLCVHGGERGEETKWPVSSLKKKKKKKNEGKEGGREKILKIGKKKGRRGKD